MRNRTIVALSITTAIAGTTVVWFCNYYLHQKIVIKEPSVLPKSWLEHFFVASKEEKERLVDELHENQEQGALIVALAPNNLFGGDTYSESHRNCLNHVVILLLQRPVQLNKSTMFALAVVSRLDDRDVVYYDDKSGLVRLTYVTKRSSEVRLYAREWLERQYPKANHGFNKDEWINEIFARQ